MFEGLTRRTILTGGLSALASAALPIGRTPKRTPARALRVVHITDTHLRTDSASKTAFARCLDKIQKQERPDLIFQGGDIVMDALSLDKIQVQAQFDLADRMLRDHLSAPIYHCLGNHDVWGWNRMDRPAISRDPRFGKGWWLEWTGYQAPYYSFDRFGWHFIFLDSIYPGRIRGYTGKLDEVQFAWLEADLAKLPRETPVCVVSHIPFLCVSAQFFGPSELSGHRWEVSGTLMHLDARRIKDLFLKYPNVKLCLSGHIHMNSHVRYNDVTHINNGAVSGAWWNGNMQETAPGYGVVDLFANGHFFSRYETY